MSERELNGRVAIVTGAAMGIGKACAVDRRKYAPEDDDAMMLLFDSEAM